MHIDLEKKTFAAWLNTQLEGIIDKKIEDVDTELRDGVYLIKLIEKLTNSKIGRRYNEHPKDRIQRLDNMASLFDFLRRENVKLNNIGPEDIVDGNVKLLRGLLFSVFCKYQIVLSPEDGGNHAELSEEGRGEGSAQNKVNALLGWVQKQTAPYHTVQVRDFSESFQDGLAFCALVHRHCPFLEDLNPEKRKKEDAFANIDQAFAAAQTHLGIPRVLDVQDVMHSPDEKSIIVYIALFYYHVHKTDTKNISVLQNQTPTSGQIAVENSDVSTTMTSDVNNVDTPLKGRPVKCEICVNDSANNYCIECRQNMCDGCSKVHASNNKDHQFRTLDVHAFSVNNAPDYLRNTNNVLVQPKEENDIHMDANSKPTELYQGNSVRIPIVTNDVAGGENLSIPNTTETFDMAQNRQHSNVMGNNYQNTAPYDHMATNTYQTSNMTNVASVSGPYNMGSTYNTSQGNLQNNYGNNTGRDESYNQQQQGYYTAPSYHQPPAQFEACGTNNTVNNFNASCTPDMGKIVDSSQQNSYAYTTNNNHSNMFSEIPRQTNIQPQMNPDYYPKGSMTTSNTNIYSSTNVNYSSTGGICYGDVIRLLNVATNTRLCSDNFNCMGAQQQQVLCTPMCNNNDDLWRIKGDYTQGQGGKYGSPVMYGDVIRLEHIATLKNLHSQPHISTLSGSMQKVWCFGQNGEGDSGDDWQVQLVSPQSSTTGQPWRSSDQVLLLHRNTGQLLRSHLNEVGAVGFTDHLCSWNAQPTSPTNVNTATTMIGMQTSIAPIINIDIIDSGYTYRECSDTVSFISQQPHVIVQQYAHYPNVNVQTTMGYESCGDEVRFGETIRLRHLVTGKLLRSQQYNSHHDSTQQVTCSSCSNDSADYWMVKGSHTHGCFSPVGAIRYGDVVRLEHLNTNKNLHSHVHHHHHHSSHTHQQEVTCFGCNGTGDAGDDWRVEHAQLGCNGQFWRRGESIRLVHALTGASLHSHLSEVCVNGSMYHQEVTAFHGRDDNDLWVVFTD